MSQFVNNGTYDFDKITKDEIPKVIEVITSIKEASGAAGMAFTFTEDCPISGIIKSLPDMIGELIFTGEKVITHREMSTLVEYLKGHSDLRYLELVKCRLADQATEELFIETIKEDQQLTLLFAPICSSPSSLLEALEANTTLIGICTGRDQDREALTRIVARNKSVRYSSERNQ